jgi:hypothetical protein
MFPERFAGRCAGQVGPAGRHDRNHGFAGERCKHHPGAQEAGFSPAGQKAPIAYLLSQSARTTPLLARNLQTRFRRNSRA